MITSKLTSKAQTTVPRSVRNALGIGAGDEVAYAIEHDRVVLTKVVQSHTTPRSEDDPFALFDEWNSEADRQAYAEL